MTLSEALLSAVGEEGTPATVAQPTTPWSTSILASTWLGSPRAANVSGAFTGRTDKASPATKIGWPGALTLAKSSAPLPEITTTFVLLASRLEEESVE